MTKGGVSPAEARNLRMRSQMMTALRIFIFAAGIFGPGLVCGGRCSSGWWSEVADPQGEDHRLRHLLKLQVPLIRIRQRGRAPGVLGRWRTRMSAKEPGPGLRRGSAVQAGDKRERT